MDVLTEEDLKEVAWRGLQQLDLVALWIRSRERVEYMTSAFARMTGLNREDMDPAEFSESSMIHPDDYERITELARQRRVGTKSPTDLAAFSSDQEGWIHSPRPWLVGTA